MRIFVRLLLFVCISVSLLAYSDLFSDPVAHDVGDLITIQIIESTSAKTQNQKKTSKNEERGAEGSTSGALDFLPSIGADIKNESSFDGGGQTMRKGYVQTTVTAQVVEKMENGNLVIQGRKKLDLSNEESFVIISGIARPQDIATNNTIRSDRLAELSVVLKGEGDNSKAEKKSIIGKLLGWIF